MARTSVHYKKKNHGELRLFIDIESRRETIQDIHWSGELAAQFTHETEELKTHLLDRPFTDVFLIRRSSLKYTNDQAASLPLFLLHKAVTEYAGMNKTLKARSDLLCLCFGVGESEIKKELLKRPDYDLKDLIAETKATSACGSCLQIITAKIKEMRALSGLIKGSTSPRSRFDKEGHWVKINDLYPGELVLKIDALLKTCQERERLLDYRFEIIDIEGHYITLKVERHGHALEKERATGMAQAFADYLKGELSVLFFFDLI